MSKKNDLFMDLLTGFLSPDFFMKFLETFNSENVSVTNDGKSVVVNVKAEISDDEYNRFVAYLLNLIEQSSGEKTEDYTLKLTVGDSKTDVYKYDHEKGKFEFQYGEDKEKIEKSDLPVKKEENKPVLSGVRCEMNEKNDIIDEMPFAQWLKSNIQTDIDNGLYKFDSDDLFDVDEAINNLFTIYETDLYGVMVDDEKDNKLTGIVVPITALCDIIEPYDTVIDTVLENESGNIAEFVKRCIFELGFSNVIPEVSEHCEDENVTCTVPIEKYKDILFKLYF